jgi:hypothetical protein
LEVAAMRRVLVVFVFLVASAFWPGAAAFARDSTIVRAVAADGLRADFNDDGFADLAIGVPAEAVGSVEFAGAVNIVYGSAGGLTGSGSQLLTQDTPGVGSTVEQADQFGHAFAAGDFNNDGVADLAVGASGERVGNVQFAGAINVLYGSTGGLSGVGSQLFTQDVAGIGSTVEEFDEFGSVLAAGDFDDDGADDLAVGVPFESVGTAFDAGAVNVLFGSAGGLSGAGSQLLTQDTPGVGSTVESDDRFGSALASGDFDNDGTADLAIGAPDENVGAVPNAGAVNVLFGSSVGLSGPGSELFTQDVTGVGSTAEPRDGFGAVLAAGDFDGNGPDDLAVGAPAEDAGTIEDAGAVNVLFGSPDGLDGVGSQLFTQDVTGVISTAEQGDFFGAALATGNLGGGGSDDLAVGAPTESVGAVLGAGAVNVLFGSPSGLSGSGSQLFTQDTAGIGGTAEDPDGFGSALTGPAALDVGGCTC